jgi:hypothetical protein
VRAIACNRLCSGTRKPIMNNAGPGMNGTINLETKEKSRRRLSSARYAAQVVAGGSASTCLTGPLLRNWYAHYRYAASVRLEPTRCRVP